MSKKNIPATNVNLKGDWSYYNENEVLLLP